MSQDLSKRARPCRGEDYRFDTLGQGGAWRSRRGCVFGFARLRHGIQQSVRKAIAKVDAAGHLILVLLWTTGIAQAQALPGSDRVRVQVAAQSQEERKNLKGTHTDQVTAHYVLTIRLTGGAKAPESRIARWRVFGKDLVSNKVRRVGAGEFAVALDASGAQSVSTERVTTTHTPDHILSHGKNRQGGKVAATGVKYMGYSVEVLDGSKVVGFAAHPPGIEKRDEP